MREFTVPPVVTVPDPANLTDPVWDNAERAGQEPQFARRVEGGGWRDVSCAEFRADVVALARGFVAAGIEPGTRIGLMSGTRYEWTVVDYAAWACGAVTVPIYETSSSEQAEWILSDSAAVACVVETADHAALVEGIRGGLPGLKHLWRIDTQDSPTHRRLPPTLDELVAAGSAVDPAEIEVRRRGVDADDAATIIYTSGTTGRPKGCVLTHRNLYSNAANAIPTLGDILHPGATTLLFLPLAHAFARLIQNAAIQARVRMGHSADVKHLVADLQEFQPTFVLAVPRMLEKVYNSAMQRAHAGGKGAIFDRARAVAIAYSEALDRSGRPGLVLRLQHRLFDRLVYRKLRTAFGGRCRAAIAGGAPLGEWLAHFFRGAGITVYEGFGLTETSPAATVNMAGATRIGTVGRPLPGVTVRVDDSGEVLVSGDLVFQGYWNNAEATADAFEPGGWLRTGDLGQLDGDGFLRITGRKKEIIVTAAGTNLAPAVLEDRLRAHPLVSQCAVVGDRRPFIAALVTIDEQAVHGWLTAKGRPTEASVAELRNDPDLVAEVQGAVDEANRAVSHAEAIKAFRILPHDFTEARGELTPTLKVKRSVVQKEYADEIEAIYSHR